MQGQDPGPGGIDKQKMFLSLLDFITIVINFHNENSNRGGKVSFIRAGWMPNFLIEQESPRINLNIIERLKTPPLPHKGVC